MDEIESLKPGTNLSNEEVCEIFLCAPQGGMRRSLRTNTLVLVSDHLKSVYEDRWLDDVFHYTGMGLRGDQDLNYSQNKTLAESDTNGIDVHLFEVLEAGKYTYQGKMVLFEDPHEEVQPDADGTDRKVWVFPLKLEDQSQTPIITKDVFDNKTRILDKKSRSKTTEELEARVKKAPKKVGVRVVVSKQYDRNSDIVELAKRRAGGICDLCELEAPFTDKSNEPFFEVHHIKWLSEGGPDTLENVVALCPNCHRRMHVLDIEEERMKLMNKAKRQSE